MSNIQTERHDEAEVFVLPPDLLEKLGINLCNIPPTANQSRKSKKEKKKSCTKSKNQHLTHEGIPNNVTESQGSSILETASLMKKSVFLSPTFVPLVDDTIPGEIEIANNIKNAFEINTKQTNTELNAKDNGSYNIILENVMFEPCLDKENNTEQLTKNCYGTGRTNIHSQSEECDISKINLKKKINSDDVKSKLKLKCLKASDIHTSTLKSDTQSLNVSKENLQNIQVCHTNNNNYETSNEKQCVASILDNLHYKLEEQVVLKIPISMQPNETCLHYNEIADHSHNIIDNHNSLIYQRFPPNKVLPVTPTLINLQQSTEQKETECDEKVDIELDNILHGTEVLIPNLSTTASSNMISIVDVDIVDGEIDELSHKKGLHNNVEDNSILESISPELTNISNITQNINDTQDINIDILYESFDEHSINNETETADIINQQLPMVSNLDACESGHQSNRIEVDILNDLDCDQTSDMELDNMLPETEILIFTPSNSSTPDSDKIQLNEENEYKIEKEVIDAFKRDQVTILESNSLGNKEMINTFLLNPSQFIEAKCGNIIINHNGSIEKETNDTEYSNALGNNEKTNTYLLNPSQVIEAKCGNIIINHNGSIEKETNDTEQSHSKNIASVSKFQFDLISPTQHTEENVTYENNTVNMLTNSTHQFGDLYDKSTELSFNGKTEHKLLKGLDDMIVNNNFVYGIETNKSKISALEISNNVTKTNDSELDKTTSRDKLTEKNNVNHSTGEIILNSQCKTPKQSIDSLGMLTETDAKYAKNNVDGPQKKRMEPDVEHKVQEIAKYLKEAYRNKKRLFKPKVEILTKSKIFIQGVEKPGGTGEQELVFDKFKLHKTYEKKKRMQLDVASAIEEMSHKTIKNIEDNSIEINTCIEPSHFTKRQDFCLCGDFGKLPDVDEYDNLYEHIHFGSNISVNCPVDTVFEIYDERTSLIPFEMREYVQEEEINSECDSSHICWQKFEYEEWENVSSKNKLNENVGVDNINLKSDVSATKHYKQLEGSVSKHNNENIQENDNKYESEVANEMNESSLTKTKIEDAVAFQLDTSCKKDENNMLLDQRDAEKCELEKKIFDQEAHSNDGNMDSTLDVSETVKKIGENVKSRKRKTNKNDVDEPPAKKNVKCGVCEQMFAESEWESHISKVHYHIAWKDGQTMDFENLLLLKKIKNKLEKKGSLICTFCGYEYVKTTKFLNHVKRCFRKKMPAYNSDGKEIEVATTSKTDLNICGVCQLEISEVKWIEHISEKHKYLAWKKGESPLDLGDEDKVNDHLLNIIKKQGHLICVNCGLLRKYTAKTIKNFLSHIANCTVKYTNVSRVSRKATQSAQSKDCSQTTNKQETNTILSKEPASLKPGFCKCAVCDQEVDESEWWDHASKQHNYRAWKYGETSPNFEDDNVFLEHLLKISKNKGGLQCSKCGLVRKYAKSYLQHIGSCTANKNEAVVGENAAKIVEESPVNASRSDIVNNAVSLKITPKVRRKASSIEVKDKDIPSSNQVEIKADVLSSDTLNSTDEKLNKLHPEIPSSDFINSADSPNAALVTCGVCNVAVEESTWVDHTRMVHNYIAWKAGETPLDLDDKKAICHHLSNIVSSAGKISCPKCGKEWKYPKKFLQHVEGCRGPVTSSNDSKMEILKCNVVSHVDRYLNDKGLDESVTELKCGVCQAVFEPDAWIAHIQTAHNYIAWIEGETPLDLNDQDMIRQHLQKLVDETGALICAKCGAARKYAKQFLKHLQQCSIENQPNNLKLKFSGGSGDSNESKLDEMVACGTCSQKIRINQWLNHIRIDHNYIAWRESEVPKNNNKPAHIEKRLRTIVDKINELTCPKCGYNNKDVKQYLQHSESCAGNPDYKLKDNSEVTKLAHKGLYKCAMCQEKIKYGEWKYHAIDKHYNVAWVVGDEPIDLFNQTVIAKFLNEYLKYGSFVCKACGIARSSASGFYAHIATCGLSEEEADKYKMTCDICGSKYLGIYKSQHMGLHLQQKAARERQEKAEENREREKARKLEAPVAGPRRAAEKAKMVIEESVRQIKHVCQSCGFATDVKEEMNLHKCPKGRKMSEEVELSLEQEESSSGEDLESEVNESDCSDIEEDDSDEELKPGRRRHHDDRSAAYRVPRVPFEITNFPEYLSKNTEEFADHYLTTDTLFPQWTRCNYEIVPENEVLETLPPLDSSCKVYSNGKWQTYKRWQGVMDQDKSTIFAGYNIQRLSWLPAGPRAANEPSLLAVACHRALDCVQYGIDDLPVHTTLVQFWDFEDFQNTAPKLVLGLVIPYGTVWAMDWCPSGAQGCLKEDNEGFVRMGLLAVACSNGFAYVLSVPYPSTVVTSDSIFCKLEPVAKLKFTMKTDRPKYQATSIIWSKQKGHSTIVVGYSDGLTAYYDLNTESPFLKAKENNVTVFYPFFDERIHNGCVTDMSSFPMGRSSSVVGAVTASSPTGGALLSAGARARCARLRSHLASTAAVFLPAWPSVFLAGDDVITMLSVNEMEYWGVGRRVGPTQACCGCQHCGLTVTFMAPYLRTLRTHHAHCSLNKKAVAWIGTKKLAKKRKRDEDKKEVQTECFKYEDTIKKYGLEFKFVNPKDEYKKTINHYEEVNPGRFPLSEVSSMAFCPSERHHRQLAVATHAGIVFVIQV